MDPNAKTGPAGYGTQGFIAGNAALAYRIEFENDPTATAPAQRVVITDSLDSNIDWSTLQFTEVGFGDNIITIPAGSKHFQTTLSMTYNGQTFSVLIELSLNTSTGLVTATFQSIDPADNLPPDILTGFLPPEDGTGRGKGYISYTAMPKAGLATGTQIRNVATVSFDINPPITTDQVDENDSSKGVDPAKQNLNTIDAGKPTSSVSALAAFRPGSFTVSWTGQDDAGGSGLAAFDVYVSDNGGEFTLWQSNTTATSATFTGLDGHTYGFYSTAFDNAGNAQDPPTGAQVTTTVDTTPPTSSVAPLPGTTVTPSFTVTWSGTDNAGGSGIGTYDVFVSDNGGPFTAFQVGTTNTSAIFNGLAGHSYSFYSVATDNVGNREATPTAAQATTFVVSGAALRPDPQDASKTALYIVGGTGPDVIVVKPADRKGNLRITINGVVQGTFKPTGHILAYGLDGNDQIKLQSRLFGTTVVKIGVPAVLDGGAGNDLVSAAGSKANNVVLGGDGNDTLTGGSGRDLLTGGQGADTVRSGGGDDIATGDRTTFDVNLDALFALIGKWTRSEDYASRINQLTNGDSPTDPYVFNAAAIPVDDGAVDLLYGQGGKDWFLDRANASARDVVKDKLTAELFTIF